MSKITEITKIKTRTKKRMSMGSKLLAKLPGKE